VVAGTASVRRSSQVWRDDTRRARFWGAAGGAPQRDRETAGSFAEDDFGKGAAAVVLRQGGGVALDIGGHCPSVPGQMEDNLFMLGTGDRSMALCRASDCGDGRVRTGARQPRGLRDQHWTAAIG